MGNIIIRHRDNDSERFHKALEMLEFAHRELTELTEKMEQQFGERYAPRGYDQRDGYAQRDGGYDQRGYYPREWERMDERQGRDSMGRYR